MVKPTSFTRLGDLDLENRVRKAVMAAIAASKTPKMKHLYQALLQNSKKNNFQLSIHKCVHELPDGALGPFFFLIMVTCYNMEAIRKAGISRGFPILFVFRENVGTATLHKQYHDIADGFYAKFENGDMRDLENANRIYASKKMSGCLGLVLFFRHPITGAISWTATSKNSADCTSMYVQEITAAFSPHVDKIVAAMPDDDKRLTFYGEVFSPCDKTHGHDYKIDASVFVVTAISSETSFDAEEDFPASTFLPPADVDHMCKRFGMYPPTCLCVRGPACAKFIRELKKLKRSATDEDINILFEGMEALDKDNVSLYGDLRLHKLLCEDGKGALEGLVIQYESEGVDDSEGVKGRFKYKFSWYVMRTMGLRPMMGGDCGNKLLPPLADVVKHLHSVALHWAGDEWVDALHYAMEAYLRWHDDGCVVRNPGDSKKAIAAPHITYSHKVMMDGHIRDGIDQLMQKFISDANVLGAPVVVYAPPQSLGVLTEELYRLGIPVATSSRGHVDMSDPCVHFADAAYPIKRLQCFPAFRLADHKMNKADHIPVIGNTAADIVSALEENNFIVTDTEEVRGIEAILRKGSRDAIDRILKTAANGQRLIVFLQAPQCSGKSYVCDKVKETLGDDVEIFSADKWFIENGEEFGPDTLHAAHRWCIISAYRSKARVILIDNVNNPKNLGPYTMCYDRKALHVGLSPELWKTEHILKVLWCLYLRNVRRWKAAIPPSAIDRTLKTFVSCSEGAGSPEAWITKIEPVPQPEHCVVVRNGVLAYTGSTLSERMEAMISGCPLIERDDRFNQQLRDGYKTYHITLLRPHEMRTHGKAKFEMKTKPEFLGVGYAKDKMSYAWYAVVQWPEADAFREGLGLPKIDLHCTLGFGPNGDVHNVPKDASTLCADVAPL